ncbi:CbiX/SirB N-terminal domain-containing protein [Dehalobacter sp. DCM]|uniref:sirohydrochlorin chelatase n=1 Tax=Dehalobacter sp. DCM TaxID=2907827 RepID=UPI00308149FD|nr:CbiX/SirB N-terminal domain-containing protein [Dehalobacter sp. DCM]
MTGILILAHGSRQSETENTLKEIIAMVQTELKTTISADLITYAFLQFSENNLEMGLKKLVDQGVNKIKIIPYFLFDGVHIQEDIPAEIDEFLKDNPGVEISFGKTLGADRRLAKILVDRISDMTGEV